MAEKEFVDLLIAKVFPKYEQVASFKVINGRKLAFGIPKPDIYPDVEELIHKSIKEQDDYDISQGIFSGETCFTCHLDSRLLAFIILEELKTRSRNVIIQDVYAEKDARGRGIADHLLHVALTEARYQGKKQALAYVPFDLEKAIKFYKRNGFKPGKAYPQEEVREHKRPLDDLPHLSRVAFSLPEKLS